MTLVDLANALINQAGWHTLLDLSNFKQAKLLHPTKSNQPRPQQMEKGVGNADAHPTFFKSLNSPPP
jgi:hypothetical protein